MAISDIQELNRNIIRNYTDPALRISALLGAANFPFQMIPHGGGTSEIKFFGGIFRVHSKHVIIELGKELQANNNKELKGLLNAINFSTGLTVLPGEALPVKSFSNIIEKVVNEGRSKSEKFSVTS